MGVLPYMRGEAMNQNKEIAEIFWKFHNDRLANPELTEMKPYIEPVEQLLLRARIDGLKQANKCVDNTIMILTNNLPAMLEHERIYKLRKVHKGEIHKLINHEIADLERQLK